MSTIRTLKLVVGETYHRLPIMPKKNDTSKAACKATSPPKETFSEKSFGTTEIVKLITTRANSEQTVLARIYIMDKKVDSHRLHKMTDSFSTDLKGQIDTVCVELISKIEPVSATRSASSPNLSRR